MNKLADDLTNPKSMKEMWQTIKSLKSYKQIKPTSRQFSDSDHIAFLHQISSAADTAECIQMDFPSFDIQTINRMYFSAYELTKFLKTRNPNSAKGPDNISYSMLLSLPPDEVQNLESMVNEILNDGTVPDSSRRIKVVPVPKKNTDSSIMTNNRPICLLSVWRSCFLPSGIAENSSE